MLGLNQKHYPPNIGLNMQLLRPVVDVHQQQIIKQQILDKIILVKPLLISHQKILHLKSRQLTYHIHIIAAASCQ